MEKRKGYTHYLALTGKAREDTSEIQCTVIATYDEVCLKDKIRWHESGVVIVRKLRQYGFTGKKRL